MQARVRDVKLKDQRECLDLLRRLQPFFGEYFRHIGMFHLIEEHWQKLLSHPCITHGLVEDFTRPDGDRIFNYGFIGFVQERWLRDYLERPTPACGQAAIREVAGEADGVLLHPRELKTVNSGETGLCAVNLFCAFIPERVFQDVDTMQAAVEAYLHAVKGFRIGEILMEVAGRDQRAVFLDSGSTKLRHSFDMHLPAGSPRNENTPILVGLNRREANDPLHRNAFSARIFRRHIPRYGFSESQQLFLQIALQHPSDGELLPALKEAGQSLETEALGRRWDRIFKRVERLQPKDAPVIPQGTSPSAKRMKLLMHLAHDYHELRPQKGTSSRE